ncbi:MAG: hypothetical protein LBQ31_08815 [Bacteroidales bacterium]|jgi:hypothetical protein|nr:hypothetical protein [Bacteroidales bacterium]
MKQIYQQIAVCALLILCPATLNAQWTAKTDTRKHQLYIAAKGGVNTFLYKDSRVKLGGGVGLFYDFYFLPFMGLGTGAEISFLRSSSHLGDISYQQEAIDDDPLFGSQGQYFIFGVDIENADEVQKATHIYVPLMLRFRFSYFYIGVGAKAGFCLNTKYIKNMGLLKTYGIYENLYDRLEDIPEHGFVTKSVTKESSWNLKTDWALSFDFGINIHPSPYKGRIGTRRKAWLQHVYFGIYADYGINSLQNATTTAQSVLYPVSYNAQVEGCLEYDLNSTTHSAIHSLSAGIKFAVGLNWK